MNVLSYILLAAGAFLTFVSKTIAQTIFKNKDESTDKYSVVIKLVGFVFVLAAVIILALTEK